MSQNRPQVITTRDAKKQVNTFGIALVIYIFLNQMLWHGIGFLQQHYPAALLGLDSELVIMIFFSVTLLIAGYGFFRIAAAALDLNIRDYLKTPKITPQRKLLLICAGIGVTYLFSAVSSFFRFLVQPAQSQFEFVGYFTTPMNIIKNAIYFVLFVIIRPWCDEYVFRGVIQRQLGHYNRYFGILASAFLYAIAQPSLMDAVPAFFTGWYLALITYRYHSIIPARRIHIAISLFGWFIAVIPDRFVIIPTILIAAVYIFTGYNVIGRGFTFHSDRAGALSSKLWKMLLTSFTIILCILLFAAGSVMSFLLV